MSYRWYSNYELDFSYVKELPLTNVVAEWEHLEEWERMYILRNLELNENEKEIKQLWDKMSGEEKFTYCSHIKVSKEFLVGHWSSMNDNTKVECLLIQKLIESFGTKELPMFLVDDNEIVRDAVINYMKSSSFWKIFWKVTDILKNIWFSFKDLFDRFTSWFAEIEQKRPDRNSRVNKRGMGGAY